MPDYWEFIEKFYSKPGNFICRNRGSSNKETEICVCHIFDAGATDKQIQKAEKYAGRPLPPSYRDFLKKTNGALFYTQISDKKECSGGFLFYPAEMVPKIQKTGKEWGRDCLGYVEEGDRDQCRIWLDSLLIIGEEIESGNYIAIDFSRPADQQEYPVIFLSHETPLEGSELDNDNVVLAGRVDELLYKAAQDPADFLMNKLGAITTYFDGNTNEQWYPQKYMISE